MFGFFSSTLKSGGDNHPTPLVLIKHMIAEMLASKSHEWVTFESKPKTGFVQVALENETLLINMSFRFKSDYGPVFVEKKISIPEGWVVVSFTKNKVITIQTRNFTAYPGELNRAAEFVAQAFPTLHGLANGYQLIGTYC